MAKTGDKSERRKPAIRWGDLFATLPAPLSPAQQRVLAAAATGLRPDDPQLVKRIRELPGFNRAAAVRAARTLRLGALTQGNLSLTRALQCLLAHEQTGSLAPLAALRPDEWLDLAYAHGSPDGMSTHLPSDPNPQFHLIGDIHSTLPRQTSSVPPPDFAAAEPPDPGVRPRSPCHLLSDVFATILPIDGPRPPAIGWRSTVTDPFY